jgi:hypothetical protein
VQGLPFDRRVQMLKVIRVDRLELSVPSDRLDQMLKVIRVEQQDL